MAGAPLGMPWNVSRSNAIADPIFGPASQITPMPGQRRFVPQSTAVTVGPGANYAAMHNMSPALVYAGGGGGYGGGGGGGYGHGYGAGETHYAPYKTKLQAEEDGTAIDATPGDAPSPMAPGGQTFGKVVPLPDPLAGLKPPVPQLAYGGGGVHKAIVGDPQSDGGPNPEMVTSASPIHVTPLRGGRMPKVPMLAYGTPLPADVNRASVLGDTGLIVSGSKYENFGGGRPDDFYPTKSHPTIDPMAARGNYSTGAGQKYRDPSDILRQQASDVHDKGQLDPNQYRKAMDMLDKGSSADEVRPLLSQAWQHNLAESRQVTDYAGIDKAKAEMAIGGDEESQESAPDDEQSEAVMQPTEKDAETGDSESVYYPPSMFQESRGWMRPMQDALGAFKSAITSDGEPEDQSQSSPVIQSPRGTAYAAAEGVRQAFNPNAPQNPNLPGNPPQLQGPAVPTVDPFHEMKSAENPMRRQRAIRDYVKRNPLAIPEMEMKQRAAAQAGQAAADKLNAENLQKHVETLRKIAHNVAQEQHWDDTIAGRNVVETAKLQEQAKKDHVKALEKEQATHDALGNVSSRLHILGKDTPANLPQRELLNHIMQNKDPKAIADGIKYYDSVYPHELTIGGQKAVGTPSGPRFVPRPAAPHGKTSASQTWLEQHLGK